MRNPIATVELGQRTLDGKDWPVVNTVERLAADEWLAVVGLCDGLPGEVEVFQNEEDALKAIEAPGHGLWKSEGGKIVKVADQA